MLPDYSAPTQLTVTTLCLEFTPTSSAPYFQDFESFPAAFGFTEELCWTGAAVDSYDWNLDDNGGTPSEELALMQPFQEQITSIQKLVELLRALVSLH